MTILSAQTIRHRVAETEWDDRYPGLGSLRFNIKPFSEAKQACGMSYGLSGCGYDIRVGMIQNPCENARAAQKPELQSLLVRPGEFVLMASLEYFEIPNDICAIVHDKSTLARQGLALQNTVLEPGWKGYITLELSHHGTKPQRILVGQPIAQVVFHKLDQPTELPYVGKYQDQGREPTPAILLGEEDTSK